MPLRLAQVVQLDPILRAALATVPLEPQKVAGPQLIGEEERALAVSAGHQGRGHDADTTQMRLRPDDRAVNVSLRSALARPGSPTPRNGVPGPRFPWQRARNRAESFHRS